MFVKGMKCYHNCESLQEITIIIIVLGLNQEAVWINMCVVPQFVCKPSSSSLNTWDCSKPLW